MQGKTTFILTDKDTGKIVDKREEKNMVTNALEDIFSIPKIGLLCGNLTNNISGYFPMYSYLLHGLLLFEENIPERKDDYIIDGRYGIVGTAGAAYTGTDSGRGSFNLSESGEIENGYRYVWDFTPEKAVGTIRCAALSSIHMGNMGNTYSAGGILVNAYDISGNTATRSLAFNGSPVGNYGMNNGKNVHYYYSYGTAGAQNFTVYKHRMLDPDSIGICTLKNAVLERSYVVTDLPFFVKKVFPNVYDKKLYLINGTYSRNVNNNCIYVQAGVLDVETGESRSLTPHDINTTIPGETYINTAVYAVFNNLLYISVGGDVYVYSFDGTLVNRITTALSSINMFFLKDKKLGMLGKLASPSTPCYAIIDSKIRYLPISSSFQNEILQENGQLKYPYVSTSYGLNLYIMMRTDYLATINNLSEPLEKTSNHALQVRYEITEG